MSFKFAHNNINVLDLEKSLTFYEKALGLHEVERMVAEDNSFTIVYLGDQVSQHKLELTHLSHRVSPYDLGDNEVHLALTTDDFAGALALHKSMDCVCYENPKMGSYFISDPDGYWLEIMPAK